MEKTAFMPQPLVRGAVFNIIFPASCHYVEAVITQKSPTRFAGLFWLSPITDFLTSHLIF
ncbi:MAG: hypothetical protein ACTHKA_19150 [Anaerocolumna jejuensis]